MNRGPNEPGDRSRLIGDALVKAADQTMRAGDIIRRLREFVSRSETEKRVERVAKLIEESLAFLLASADLDVRTHDSDGREAERREFAQRMALLADGEVNGR